MLTVPGSPCAAAIVIERFSLFVFVYCFFVFGRRGGRLSLSGRGCWFLGVNHHIASHDLGVSIYRVPELVYVRSTLSENFICKGLSLLFMGSNLHW